MSTIDFQEIPEAHFASGEQDTWELFGADFFEALGYKVVDRPSRGPDLGKDLLLVEVRTGVAGDTEVRWLVSCKHHAHSGRSVGLEDEQNIVERVEGKKCQGFIGCYSTLPSSSLAARLKELESRFEVQTFDRGRIEKHLLAKNCTQVAERYFPTSFREWTNRQPSRAAIFSQREVLECEACGKDLLLPEPSGIFVLWRNAESTLELGDELVDVHWCCKGHCDSILESKMLKIHGLNVSDAWQDLSDLCVPLIYLQWLMGLFNGYQQGDQWSAEAFEKIKSILIVLYQHVARDASPAEKERIQDLTKIPRYLGGLGSGR